MGKRAPKYSISLAAGKGTRMHSATLPKVCFPIDGQPAINRNLAVHKGCGINSHIVVVGSLAGQVVETVGREHEGVVFVYQAEQLGTAHAARQGAGALALLDEQSEVLVVAGDRVIEPVVLEKLFDLFYSSKCDLAFLTGPKKRPTDPGRVLLYSDGSVMGNVEVRDVLQRRIYTQIRDSAEKGVSISRDDILKAIRKDFSDKKAALAFGELWQAVAVENREPLHNELISWIRPEMTCFEFCDQAGMVLLLSPQEVDAAPLNNSSVYLVKKAALNYSLARLNSNNAQGEEYLSDMITILAQARRDSGPLFRVQALHVDNPNYIMAFNDPAELLEIETYVQAKKHRRLAAELDTSQAFRTIADWLESFQNIGQLGIKGNRMLWQELAGLYSDNPEVIRERIQSFIELLNYSKGRLGPEKKVILVRSPGRVNMLGRHVDHQGGHCNLMTIGYETLMAVHPRSDDQLWLYNLDKERFPERSFSIGELVADLPWDDWISLVNSEKVSRLVHSYGGDWAQYVKASVLRLQKKFVTQRLRGADLIVTGNIPVAAGLSSSSALVVGAAEAIVAVNQLDTFPNQLVDLCGEGEWFVGTRGGSADHAAIKLGQKGKVVKVTFFDFAVEKIVPFPRDYILAVCDSGIKAQKSANAKDQFNHRVACYRIGLLLIRKNFPQYDHLLHHLRDVNIRTLGVPLSWIYKILLRLPERVSRGELRALLAGDELEAFFNTHKEPEDGSYPIRGVVLYGLAECERSRLFSELLAGEEVEEIGRLMSVSHNGDRVVSFDSMGKERNYSSPTSNGYLLDLIEDLESGDPERVMSAQLQWQPGAYRCSVPEIDKMVDTALATDGVVGAQLAGAGLGGCMMVLAHKDQAPALVESLTEHYYRLYDKPVSILLCKPISGSGVLLKNSGYSD
jgi:N-acetylgalactosamine kinase